MRLRFTDAAGNYYAPLGRLARVRHRPRSGRRRQLAARREAVRLHRRRLRDPPAGRPHPRRTVGKGRNTGRRPWSTQLAAGKLALRLSVERWTNLREQGWYSGDTRAHYLSPHAALLEAAAEDLAVVNVLAFEDRRKDQAGEIVPAIPNILDFSGQKPALELPGHLVAVNTHNTHPVLGSLGLLNTPPRRLPARVRRVGRRGRLDAARLVRPVPP